MKRLRSPLQRYGLALGGVLAAAAVRLALDPLLGDRLPYLLFLAPVVAAAFFARFAAAVAAILLSTAVANYLFVEPRYAFDFLTPRALTASIYFVVAAAIAALVADYVSRTRERLRQAAEARAEQDRQARAERARLQDIIDSIPGVVWEAWGEPDSAAQRINYVSGYVEKMLGYTPEEWTSQPNFWLRLVPEEDREQAARVAAETFARGESGENEFRWTTRDGRTIWALARSSVIKDEAGRPIGMRGVTFDITDRKQAVQRLSLLAKISTTSLTTTFQELAQDIARSTARVVGDYCIVRILREGRLDGIAWAHTRPEAEPLIQRFAEHPIMGTESRLYAAVMREQKPVVDNDLAESAFAHVDRTGLDPALLDRYRARRGLVCPLVSHGRLLGTLALGRATASPYTEGDVRLVEAITSRATLALDNAALFETAQREAEEARRARAEAEEAGRVKDEFLATLSHELRTPLNAILGWAHLLRDQALPHERRHAAVETIIRNARSQEQLIADILDVQRIMTGKIRLNVRSVDLGAIIRSAAETVQPMAANKHVRLQLLVDLDVPAIPGDPERLQQIVWNLLSNGIKFAPKDGHVQVRLLKEDECCRLVVQDDGPGIDPAFAPYLFERFRQADSSTTRTHKGLGLGLAIVRSLVEMHGGTITAENVALSEGSGAVFTIRLPWRAPDPVAAADGDAADVARIADAPPLDGLRVLVVEDDNDARELIGTILERCGATVTLTSSAGEGFQAATTERPDVIVSDIEMPEQDGYDFIRRIRALGPERGGDVPAAALTAYASPADRTRVLGAGFDIHVAKPVQPAELATVVANLAGRRAAG